MLPEARPPDRGLHQPARIGRPALRCHRQDEAGPLPSRTAASWQVFHHVDGKNGGNTGAFRDAGEVDQPETVLVAGLAIMAVSTQMMGGWAVHERHRRQAAKIHQQLAIPVTHSTRRFGWASAS
jgi:hypothetical protein